MKNKISIFLILFSVHILGFSSATAQWSEIDSTAHILIKQGIHQVHIEEYKEAIATFEKLITLYPEHPMGYFLSAAVYQTIMRNYRINIFETQLDSLLNLAIQFGEKTIRKSWKNIYAYFFLGGAYGFRGFHKVRKRDWIGAFQDGLKGLNELKKAIAMNPQLYDVYYGLGVYHYWRSAKAKFLRFLSFIKNDQQRGINELWTAIDKGRYTSIDSKYALVAIYYDKKDYQKALSLNQELIQLFPTNPACLYLRGRIYEQLANWNEANINYQQLLSHLLISEYKSVGYKIECYYRIGYCHYKLGEFEQASTHIQTALSLTNKRDPSREIEGPLENLNEIIKSIKQLQQEINKLITYSPDKVKH